jgi:ubiquinone/menaquinone biosynthesis C-methylase UbiE
MPEKKDTSWEHVADWYHTHVNAEGTYHADVVLPNLLRLMNIKKEDAILDIGCGEGFFARAFHAKGAVVSGTDISPRQIEIAKKTSPKNILFFISAGDKLAFAKNKSADTITIILALQNMENANAIFAECSRILKPKGKLYIVLNHPSFRIPKASEWGWDAEKNIQYRRVDQYLSELKSKISMHPGKDPSAFTLSFHRPLQLYFKLFNKHSFVVTRLEEWISNKKSVGSRGIAENRARHEFPLFMCIEAEKQE